ncbi:hypothetical protein Scep_015790 [Stephania cephalantha]|uniref:Uncharacterized protein n=1 Tax=Stephania cephalantha TaxID=152367 RepID=A0AAP0J3S8_9MAGN
MSNDSEVVAIDAKKDHGHDDPKREEIIIGDDHQEKSDDQEGQEKIIDDHDDDHDEKNIGDKVLASSTSSPPLINDEDDDDGFRTPTSTAHRIPEPQECPPAPMAEKLSRLSSTNKRKASDSGHRLHHQIQVITLPEDLSSVFHPLHRDHLDQKMKKARSDDQ